MSEDPKVCDPRGRRSKSIGLHDAIEKFKSEVPDGQISINLGCGQTRMDGFVNVDWMPDDAVDVAYNLFTPDWPFPDGSVGFVYMSHLLEHVPGTVWATFWNEMWRVCGDEARVVVIGPHAHSNRFLQDPTHCQPLIDAKFQYLSKYWREANKLNHAYYGGKDLNFLMDIRPWKLWAPEHQMKEESVKQWAEVHYNNVIDDCVWFLRKFATAEALERYTAELERQLNGQEARGQPIDVGSAAT